MKKSLKIMFVSIALTLIPTFMSANVSAQANLACDGLSISSGGDCEPKESEPTFQNVIKSALNILSFVAGAIAVIMVIIAGTRFMTSQGDPGKVAGARSAVIYAVIGILIVVLAQSIVFFVLRQATSEPANPTPGPGPRAVYINVKA